MAAFPPRSRSRPRSTTRRPRPPTSRRASAISGKPDTESGQQAKDSVDELSKEIDADIATIEDAVDGATGVGGIVNAVQVISATVSKAGSQVTDTLTSFQDLDAKGELESAFKDAPGCQKLTGGS